MRRRLISILSLTVLVAGSYLFWTRSYGNSLPIRVGSFLGSVFCSDTVELTAESPDGQRSALVILRDGGATAHAFQVRLQYTSWRRLLGDPIIFVSEAPITVVWHDNHQLIIYCQEDQIPTGIPRMKLFGDLRISYEHTRNGK